MSVVRSLKMALAVGALSLTAACASGFNAQVQRFQSQLPAPQGQTFAIAAIDAEDAGGLEFGHYAGLVAQRLAQYGYRPAADGASADLVVRLGYGVDNGRERVVRDPFYDPFWGPGWHNRGFYGRPVIVRTRHGYRYVNGWYDPFLFGPAFGDQGDLRSYTVYTSGLNMVIERQGGDRVFEGSAEAVSRTNDLTVLVPNLVEAMFTGFPGNSGERTRITVAPTRRD